MVQGAKHCGALPALPRRSQREFNMACETSASSSKKLLERFAI